ncbi:hypothetical protein PR048_033364 [Dryococelus australis]|uniref:Uncharacterized protein n=1 Tax=Dryococelus australis TaxID=614101 RepID=A0ABQ9G369_9NEOP|nr:hypothetical protein PR048_033364 [Dryococelus australis]
MYLIYESTSHTVNDPVKADKPSELHRHIGIQASGCILDFTDRCVTANELQNAAAGEASKTHFNNISLLNTAQMRQRISYPAPPPSWKILFFHDVIYYEPIAKFVPYLILISHFATKWDESEIQNHEISLVQHFYIRTKIKLNPGSELGSFDLVSGKMLVQPVIIVSAEKQFDVGTRRLVVCSQRDRSTSSLVCGPETAECRSRTLSGEKVMRVTPSGISVNLMYCGQSRVVNSAILLTRLSADRQAALTRAAIHAFRGYAPAKNRLRAFEHNIPVVPTSSPIRDRMILVPNQDPLAYFQTTIVDDACCSRVDISNRQFRRFGMNIISLSSSALNSIGVTVLCVDLRSNLGSSFEPRWCNRRLDCSPPARGEPGSIPGAGSLPDFREWGTVSDDAADRRVFSGISRPPPPATCIPALLHYQLRFTASALNHPPSPTIFLSRRREVRDGVCLCMCAYCTRQRVSTGVCNHSDFGKWRWRRKAGDWWRAVDGEERLWGWWGEREGGLEAPRQHLVTAPKGNDNPRSF